MRRLVLLALVAAALAAASTAAAHPLGNFTINRYSRIDVSGSRLYVLYVLDMAEIPTYAARQAGVDPRAYARRIADGLRLDVDGRRATLRPLREALAFPRGAAGLRTMRLEVVLAGPALDGRPRIRYRDGNYADRVGWREIVVRAERGATILRSSAPGTSVSDELRAYPRDLLQSPLAVDAATLAVEAGTAPGAAPTLTGGATLQAPDRVADSGFTRLIARGDLSALVVVASLAAAFFWGAAHALSPGHGKTIVTAYLVGQRGTPRHAAILGLVVTATHTIGVFALGLLTLSLSHFVVPDRLYPWLNVASGALVVAIGATVLAGRLRRARTHDHDGHAHAHGHDHAHGHHHHHHHDHHHAAPTPRSLIAVGISGGLLPCPSALVVLLAAISLHRIGFGLLLIVAFSAGLAASITGVGLVAVLAKSAFRRVSLDGPLLRLLPSASALVIVVAGSLMLARSLPKLG